MNEDRKWIYREKIRILEKDCRLWRKLLQEHEDMLKLAKDQLRKLQDEQVQAPSELRKSND